MRCASLYVHVAKSSNQNQLAAPLAETEGFELLWGSALIFCWIPPPIPPSGIGLAFATDVGGGGTIQRHCDQAPSFALIQVEGLRTFSDEGGNLVVVDR